ncbi:MAG: DNA translocase FtsK 4TM domain-containing protein [Leptospiraceae bacterium]|nr:DNA translocase FtsK 4TM domain-containing protein [Leptospiraceae bacterium]
MAGITAKSPPKKSKNLEKEPGKRLEPFYPFLFFFFAVFTEFSLISYDQGEYGAQNNLFGNLGHFFATFAFWILGRASYFLPILGGYYGFVLFHKKDPNFQKLFASAPLLLGAASILLNIFEFKIETVRDGGGTLGVILSNFLEVIIGKSGRIILSVSLGVYGVLLMIKEFPRKIDKEFWASLFAKNKDRVSLWMAPKSSIPATEPEVNEIPQDVFGVTEEVEDLPWIEIKKIGRKRGFPKISDLSESMEGDEEEGVYEFRHETEFTRETSSDRISRLKSSIEKTKELLKKEIEKSEGDSGKDFESGNKPSFRFSETPPSLREKISPPEETMEAEALDEWEETDLSLREPEPNIDEEPITSEELEGLFYREGEISEEEQEDSYPSEPDSERFSPLEKSEETESREEDLDEEREEEFESADPFPEEKQPRLNFGTNVPKISFLRKAAYKIPIRLFQTNSEKKSSPIQKLEAEYIAKKIQEIIKEYGYESKIEGWQKGPIVTRFEISPPIGVKLSRITSLSDELRLYLAVKSIRIVAPIPGKSTIGIEVPNKYRENVFLGDILREKMDEPPADQLKIVIGKDSISGETISINLSTLPHLLVAGTTGSGKSVSMNSMISYLIYSKSPEDVRFIMIDPKMVEMSLYESIPHLLLPVITDPRKATKALNWAVQEMEARYSLISDLKCRDIRAYNEKVGSSLLSKIRHKKMPYIVIFIDELSDLMMVSGKELEDYITRISQKARAVGIHLIMATQRPSVDVITGLIKANCPARMAFHVAQKNDSKIILDYSGADTLLGKGDFLYKSPTSPDLQRIQAPFISEEEIERMVEEAKSFAKVEYASINLDEESFKEDSSDGDELLFEEAWNIVRTERKASASYLQRRMRIGYNKAARLMELMEERGYVGPQVGSKPREILR